VRLEGSLDAFSLPDIFALLSMTKKTGGLHLRRDRAQGVVWFTTGEITGGASDTSRQMLARRLVGSGLVGDEVLQAAVEAARGDQTVGVVRALQQAGAVSDETMHDVLGEHIVDTVFDLLRWPDGDFAFELDAANPDDVGVTRSVDDVVAEARRRLDTWSAVAAAVPSPDLVLTVAPAPPGDPDLTRDEWSLLALVDGVRSVGEIVALCGRGDYAVVSALADLVGRGLLRAGEESDVAAVIRRHQLLATLESATPAAVPASRPSLVAEPEPAFAEPTAELAQPAQDRDDDSDHDSDDDSDEYATVAEVTPLPSGEDQVTPKRPEPFLPKRQPEHPEEPIPAVVAAAGGGASPTPAAAAYIERDPSVNKSLLLRLIAGVRGL
jgi:hypothetical protein